MNKKNKIRIPNQEKYSVPSNSSKSIDQKPVTNSLLSVMRDGKEFESVLSYRVENLNSDEIRNAIKEISEITGRYTICYLANSINSNIKGNTSINATDDLPFREMIKSVPGTVKEIDIILVTPGGSGEQVAKFVDKLRPRFDIVRFLLPDSAMSAGTIFVMSGDEIIMTPDSYIGPIDPQVPNRDGRFVPAQSLLALIEDIKLRGDAALKAGQQPNWTDIQILNRIDHKDLGSAISGSNYSIGLVKDFLAKYKFKSWEVHKSTGKSVTLSEKEEAAYEIARKFCDHTIWKSHSRGITREIAWQKCQLQITHAENVAGLERVIRRFWAVIYWIFENSLTFKIFISPDYSLIRQDIRPQILPKS